MIPDANLRPSALQQGSSVSRRGQGMQHLSLELATRCLRLLRVAAAQHNVVVLLQKRLCGLKADACTKGVGL